MNELQRHLERTGGVPLDAFLAALRRTTARVGPDAVLDDATLDVVERELHEMALEDPEGEVFR